MVKKYVQIPVKVEAVQWTGKNFEEIKEFLNGGAHLYSGCLFFQSLDGEKTANVSEYITKSGTDNYPVVRAVEAEVFEKVYMEVE